MTVLANAQKLKKALRTCKRKPRWQRASCKKQAQQKYGTTATKAKKR
jgi:transposase-like protein